MKIFAYISILTLVLLSCSKEQTTIKKLNGSWKLVHMKFFDHESIMYLPTCSGDLVINSSSDQQISYTMNTQFDLNGNVTSESAEGTITLKEKASKLELTVNRVDTSYIEQQTLLVLNKTDLRVEFFDLNGDKRVYTFLKN